MTTKVSLIADSSVTGAAINNLTITTDDIANNAVTTSKIDFGTALVPLGAILMWSGVTAPSGYQLCNNSELPSNSPLRPTITNTPDLRERFIVGAMGNGIVTGDGYDIGETGGINLVKLSSDEVPKHNHGVSELSNPGNHAHNTFNGDEVVKGKKYENFLGLEGRPHAALTGTPDENENMRYQIRGSAAGPDRGATSGNGGHTHTFTMHTAFGNAQGETDAHENRPPYYALAFIMRVL
jgi:microcystin-dependent protein